ncbi:unnamed protein product [Symbiodinium sp. CCMP2592]|nr:unnamed protein product [Symbiodinium sp. CCMP2592]
MKVPFDIHSIPGSSDHSGHGPCRWHLRSTNGCGLVGIQDLLPKHDRIRKRQGIAQRSEHCADELSALHAEVHQGISEIRAQLSKEADRTSVRTMCMEAELEFHHSRQVSPVRTPTEVGMLAHSVLAQRNESELPSLRQGAGSDVGYLIQACKSLSSSTEGSDEGSDAAMSIATKLGALLEEVDRDCHAMALALDDMDGGLAEGWVELLCLAASHGAAGDLPAPSLACLEVQLALENDMLRAVTRIRLMQRRNTAVSVPLVELLVFLQRR